MGPVLLGFLSDRNRRRHPLTRLRFFLVTQELSTQPEAHSEYFLVGIHPQGKEHENPLLLGANSL